MPFDSTSAGTISLSVGCIPGHFKQIDVPRGLSVREILDRAEVNPDRATDYSLTVNNRPASMDDTVDEKATVLLARKIEGN